MTEGGQGIFDKIKHRFERKPVQPSSEDIAREALMLVSAAGPKGQEPIAKYQGDIDFKDHGVGSVFRIRIEDKLGEGDYEWIALGKVDPDKKTTEVFWPSQAAWETRQTLKLKPDWKLRKTVLTKTYFEIKELNDAIWMEAAFHAVEEMLGPNWREILKQSGQDEDETDPKKIVESTEAALIQAGQKEKKKVREQEKAGLRELKTSTPKVGI